jgi:uncharacterized protein YjiS (DUF1127 family)
MTISTPMSGHAIGFAARLQQTAAALLAAAWRAYRLRTCRRMLYDLPDEVLKDIGISRCEVRAIAQMIVDCQVDETRRSARFSEQM